MIHNENKAILILNCGLPCSGKSTYTKILEQRFAANGGLFAVICPDEYRLAYHGEAFDDKHEAFIWDAVKVTVKALLKRGYVVVLDATNISKARRESWRLIASGCNARTFINYFPTNVYDCLYRNYAIKRMSSKIIVRMNRYFQVPTEDECDCLVVVPCVDELIKV